MVEAKDKYSLVIVPKGEAGEHLQTFIEELAQQHDAPAFVPHITIVGKIFASPEELVRERGKAAELARQVGKFTVTLTNYGFKDEEHRCLFLLASSPKFETVYSSAASIYPQVNDQHFRGLPHLSVLYGNYSEETKKKIIESHPFKPLEFAVESFDLFKTTGQESDWALVE